MTLTNPLKRALLAPVAAVLLLGGGLQAQAAFAPSLGLTGGVPDLNVTLAQITYDGTSVLTFSDSGAGVTPMNLAPPGTPFNNALLSATVNLISGALDKSLTNSISIVDTANSNAVLLAGTIYDFGVVDQGTTGVFELLFKTTVDTFGFGNIHLGLLATASDFGGATSWADGETAFTTGGLNVDIFPAPAPATLALLGFGLIGLRVLRRRAA